MQHKRWRAAISGDAFYSEMGTGGIQTLYFGKRPNLIRIYDKQAEYRNAYKKLVGKLGKDVEPPSFEAVYGIQTPERALTRVERQIGGRVPKEVATLGDVMEHHANLRPFTKLRILEHATQLPKSSEMSFETYCTAMFLRRMAGEDGMQATDTFLAVNSSGNAGWARRKYSRYLPSASDPLSVTNEGLQQRFAESLHRQLAA